MDEETAYEAGKLAMAQRVLSTLLPYLGGERDAEAWRLERADVVQALRSLCADFGDNDWPDDLHLGDVIEKHLAPGLYARLEEGSDDTE
jgi:hypothetical protein